MKECVGGRQGTGVGGKNVRIVESWFLFLGWLFFFFLPLAGGEGKGKSLICLGEKNNESVIAALFRFMKICGKMQ